MKTWFITGTSRGFGRQWAEAALERGDRIAATARNAASLDDLVERYGEAVLPLALDVTDREAVFRAVAQTTEHFGRIDISINNAGYGLFGALEEVSEAEVRAQFDTNVFGALWVTQAVLPIMRAQRSGHIIQVSSIAGIVAFPTLGLYHASKWALEGATESLAKEVADFGIRVTLIEPTPYSTGWYGSSSIRATAMPEYDAARAAWGSLYGPDDIGDPAATSPALFEIVDAEQPPLRIFFGRGPLDLARRDYEQRLATWEEWNDVSEAAHGRTTREK